MAEEAPLAPRSRPQERGFVFRARGISAVIGGKERRPMDQNEAPGAFVSVPGACAVVKVFG